MQRKEYQRQKNATAVEHSHVVLTDETYAARNARNDSKSSSMSGTSLTPYSEVKAMLPPLSTLAIARTSAFAPQYSILAAYFSVRPKVTAQRKIERANFALPRSRIHDRIDRDAHHLGIGGLQPFPLDLIFGELRRTDGFPVGWVEGKHEICSPLLF